MDAFLFGACLSYGRISIATSVSEQLSYTAEPLERTEADLSAQGKQNSVAIPHKTMFYKLEHFKSFLSKQSIQFTMSSFTCK